MSHVLNTFFQKIFLISIPRNQRRLQLFLEANTDLDVEIFHGTDGQLFYPERKYVAEFPPSFFDEHCLSYDRVKCFNKGQLGCAISNRLLQKTIVENKLTNALILEDDAFLLPSHLECFTKATTELPGDWELFYLGYNPLSPLSEHSFLHPFVRLKHFLKPSRFEQFSSGDYSKNFFSSGYSKNLKKAGVYAGTHAYSLTYEGARKLIEIDTPLRYGYDTTLMYANYHKIIKGFALRKQLFIPNKFFETSLIG